MSQTSYPHEFKMVWGDMVRLLATTEITGDPADPDYYDTLDPEGKLNHLRHQLAIIEKEFSRAMLFYDK